MKLDAGEHRNVTSGVGGVPVRSVLNRGPGAVLVEGRMVVPGSAWVPDVVDPLTIVVSTLPDAPADLDVAVS